MSTPRPLAIALWVIAAAGGALLLALSEVLVVGLTGGLHGFGAGVLLFGVLLGLYLPAGMLLGLVLGLLWRAGSLAVGTPLGLRLSSWVSALSRDPARDLKAAAWALSFALSALV